MIWYPHVTKPFMGAAFAWRQGSSCSCGVSFPPKPLFTVGGSFRIATSWTCDDCSLCYIRKCFELTWLTWELPAVATEADPINGLRAQLLQTISYEKKIYIYICTGWLAGLPEIQSESSRYKWEMSKFMEKVIIMNGMC